MTDHERAIEVAARAARTLQFGKDEWDDLPEAIRIVWIGLAAETVKAYLAALGDGWQPMESAPRDGMIILVWSPSGEHSIAYWGLWLRKWQLAETGRYAENADLIGEPTHWRPLPAPPQEPK